MATLIHMAKISEEPSSAENPKASGRGERAEALLVQLFRDDGWKVVRPSHSGRLDVRRGAAAYVVVVKAASEGRSDRLIPLWSQACLQALRAAGANHPALAVVAAPRVASQVAEQVLKFAAEYAPDAAAGVIDFEGLRRFQGPHLEGLDRSVPESSLSRLKPRHEQVDLFSDLNQWMLKVLLAPELPDRLLAAPRGQYRNASQLARAANVSVMSAFRAVQQLQREGYLHESSPYLRLVRREELFRRWQASAAQRIREIPMQFLLNRDPRVELRNILNSGRACLGLFAAANALKLGFVDGVPPHVYLQRLGPSNVAAWKNLVPAAQGAVPDLILRQARAPQSIFRGSVRVDDQSVSDVLQVWLDVSAHPSRGKEQADLIRRRVLEPVIEESHQLVG